MAAEGTVFQGLAETGKVYKVSELTVLIKGALEVGFPSVWVEGEVSNYKRHTSGHVFFTLKDAGAVLRVVIFRGAARNMNFEPTDGMKVKCRGRISVFEARGDYQLYAEEVEKYDEKGELLRRLEELKAKLMAEGLFAEERKRKLPLRPCKIGIVTSPTGAAIRDILKVLERRYARLHILLYPAPVQGQGAAEAVAAGLDYLGGRPDIDVIIVGRGGGSIEDLWAFNEEPVARAIFRSPKPVISAVGHEVDWTIADLVADLRAPTPSAAAEMVVATEEAFEEKIENLARRLRELVRYSLQEKRAEVAELARHRIFENFRVRLVNMAQRVDELENLARRALDARRRRLLELRAAAELARERLWNLMRSGLREKKAAWERCAAALDSLSPLNVLKKGYTLCWKHGGLGVIHSVDEVSEGDEVIVSFYRGEFEAGVSRIDRERLLESRFVKEQK